MGSSSGDSLYTQFLYGTFFMYLCKQSSRWLLDCLHKYVKMIPYKNWVYKLSPDDEPMRFETCRRRQKSNYSVNLKSVHFVGFCCIIVSHSTLKKKIIKVRYTVGLLKICSSPLPVVSMKVSKPKALRTK